MEQGGWAALDVHDDLELVVEGTASAGDDGQSSSARPAAAATAAGACAAASAASWPAGGGSSRGAAAAGAERAAGVAGGGFRAAARGHRRPSSSTAGGGRARSRSSDADASSQPAGGGGGGAAVGEKSDGFFPAFQPLDDAGREQRRAARWEEGKQQAESLVADAIQRRPDEVAVARPWMQLPKAALLQRVHGETTWVTRGGRRAYIGSTSDPGWRWRGGWYLQSQGDRGGRDITEAGWRFLPGHQLEWRSMLVLGCWRDSEAALMERDAIKQGRTTAPGRLTNKASDARGLEIRPWSFSFVYICFDKRV